jgi:hypothetical protein
MDEEDEDVREVFAHYGLAMYASQVSERDCALVLATAYGPGPTVWNQGDFDKRLAQLHRLTLGGWSSVQGVPTQTLPLLMTLSL